MSDDEYNAIGMKMVEMFDEKLVDEKVQPIIFQYQAKLAKWVLQCEKDPIENDKN
jgi:hypothetical protein